MQNTNLSVFLPITGNCKEKKVMPNSSLTVHSFTFHVGSLEMKNKKIKAVFTESKPEGNPISAGTETKCCPPEFSPATLKN